MKLSKFLTGLQTLQPYYKGGDGYHLGAEHDQFYAYATAQPLTVEDQAKMRELGWFQPDCGDDAPYSPEDGWSCFV